MMRWALQETIWRIINHTKLRSNKDVLASATYTKKHNLYAPGRCDNEDEEIGSINALQT